MERRFTDTSTLTALLVGCTFLGVFLFSAYRINDNDVFRHLKVGEYILDTGSIPDRDPFACTTERKPFLLDSWLPSVFFYSIFSCCGFAGLVFFKAAIVTFTFFLLWVTVRRDIQYPHVVMWIFLLAALVARGRFEVRPQIITMGFLALEYYLLESVLRYGKGKYLPGIILLLVVWANTHSGWSYGVVLLGLTVLAEGVGYVKMLIRKKRFAGGNHTILLHLVCVFFISLVISLATVQVVNPSGFRVLLLPLMIEEESFFRNIREFMPAYRYVNPYFFGFALLLVGSFLVNYRSVVLRELFISVFFLVLAVRYSRASYPFVVLTCPMMIRNTHGYIDRVAYRKMVFDDERKPLTRPVVGAAFMLLVLVVALVMTNGSGYQPGFGLNRKKEVLFRMSSLIGEKRLEGNIFTCSPSEGDFFIWSRWPDNRVFVDGRGAMVYEEKFYVKDFLKVVNREPGWEELLDHHNVRIIITSLKMCVQLFFELERNPNWEMVFQDEGYRMYVCTSHSGGPGIN